MFDFGDELAIQSYRIPWLIWIQILVLFLIVLLFYSFSFSTTDDDPSPSSTSSSSGSADSPSSSISRADTKKIAKDGGGDDTSTAASDYLRHCQVTRSQSIKGEVAMTTATTGRRIVGEETAEGDTITDYHPCNYIRLAKLVFLKCFGLDCELDRSSSPEKKKKRR